MYTCRLTSSSPPPPAALLSLHSVHCMDADQWHPGPLTSHTTSLPSLMQIRILATNLLSSECLFNGVGRWLFRGCAVLQCGAFTDYWYRLSWP